MTDPSHRILRPSLTCEGIYGAVSTGLLIDVRDYYRAFLAAAERAESFIYIAGWQFDSTVELLRGQDLRHCREEDVRLLPFLKRLCAEKPELRIRMLAWDFSVLFALEREWFQEWLFSWGRDGSGIDFRFDNSHPVGGSHHQKFAVIDGSIAFVGGADICSNRWDDRSHTVGNPERIGCDGNPYGPYHDIHSYHTGAVAHRLTGLFLQRWREAGGSFDETPPLRDHGPLRGYGLPLAAASVGIARTQPRILTKSAPSICEIRNLYCEAIGAADRLIYIENQYFSSTAVFHALQARMLDAARSRLDIVLVLPKKPEALREEFTLGAAQMKMLDGLRRTAEANGHTLGIYYVCAPAAGGEESAVYIHSKLLLVDDRFLTIGSANTTNRSMGLDSELNVAWEAEPDDRRLRASIRAVRVSLLMEHTGLHDPLRRVRLRRTTGLVDYLDSLAGVSGSRLRRHTLDTLFHGQEWLQSVAPDEPLLDPDKPVVEEAIFEALPADSLAHFLKGIAELDSWVATKSRNQAGASLLKDRHSPGDPVETLRASILFWVMLLTVAILMAGLILFASRVFTGVFHLSLPPVN